MKRLFTFFLLTLLLLAGCGQPLAAPPETSRTDTSASDAPATSTVDETNKASYPTDELDLPRVPVELVKAVDGDTIRVMYEGKKEYVRFLLVDTPETSHPKMGVQPFGPESKEFTKELVEQADLLELEFDIGPNRDRYSRLLAYVYADGKMVQEELLEQGLARVAYIYPPNVRYVDKFNDLQRISQEQSLGIWSIENYAQEDGFYPEEVEKSELSQAKDDNPAAADAPEASAKETEAPANGCNIKGNINSKGEKIYHTPESRYYDRTKQEQWFCTEQEAQEAGFRAPLR